jgi:septal ring factor EnvC (AmiA/AmiB activator)
MPITQKFLVGSVPCLIQFSFENDYSWMREKVISYKITVTPPSAESLSAGRRRRATACLKTVEEDFQTAESRLAAASKTKSTLEKEVEKLQLELNEKKKALTVAEKEEAWLQERKALRLQQIAALKDRLEGAGWADEKDLPVVNNNNKANGKK